MVFKQVSKTILVLGFTALMALTTGCWESDAENAAEDVVEKVKDTAEEAKESVEDTVDEVEK